MKKSFYVNTHGHVFVPIYHVIVLLVVDFQHLADDPSLHCMSNLLYITS